MFVIQLYDRYVQGYNILVSHAKDAVKFVCMDAAASKARELSKLSNINPEQFSIIEIK